MTSRVADRGAHEVEAGQSRQGVDAILDAIDELHAIATTEQVGRRERGLDLGYVAVADRCPLVAEEPLGDLLGLSIALEEVAGVRRVVRCVAALLAHDPTEQFGEHGMVGDAGQPVVRRIRSPLVDRSPRHVHRGELANAVAEQPEDQRTEEQVALVPLAHLDQPFVVRGPVVGGEHASERLTVPVLLVVPQREERGELRVLPRRHQQQLARVQDRLVLDVVHVRQAAQHVRVQRVRAELLEIEVVGLEPTALFLKFLDGNCHAEPSGCGCAERFGAYRMFDG